MSQAPIRRQEVDRFWEHHPVAAASIDAPLGTAEYFQGFDRLREAMEPAELRERVYGFQASGGKRSRYMAELR